MLVVEQRCHSNCIIAVFLAHFILTASERFASDVAFLQELSIHFAAISLFLFGIFGGTLPLRLGLVQLLRLLFVGLALLFRLLLFLFLSVRRIVDRLV